MPDSSPPAYRIGHGYDLHRLKPLAAGERSDRPLMLAGERFEEPVNVVGHSDGDVVYHAVTDAILGALGRDDLGSLFPDTDERYANADSSRFVAEAVKLMHGDGYAIGNVDITVICERPKINRCKATLVANLSSVLACDASRINTKGKTHEKVDAVGEGRAIECHVVVLLERA